MGVSQPATTDLPTRVRDSQRGDTCRRLPGIQQTHHPQHPVTYWTVEILARGWFTQVENKDLTLNILLSSSLAAQLRWTDSKVRHGRLYMTLEAEEQSIELPRSPDLRFVW